MGSGAAGDGSALDLSLLMKRMDELKSVEKEREADERVSQMLATATNWRTGRCAQRTVCVIADWVRKLRCEAGLLVCGTYSGDVVVADVDSGEVLHTWSPPSSDENDEEELNEITALDFDGAHIGSGDAGGAVHLRTRDGLEMSARHAGVVTGVHWRGGDSAFTCAADRRLIEWDVRRGEQRRVLSAARPIISMSVCQNFAALGLDNGKVVLCTLSPLREMFAFDAHSSAASAVKLLTSSMLVTSSAAGEVALWRLDESEESGRRCVRFKGHSAPV
eukprot:CAMPEP_0183370754 /NCGR_PEP_ID=MMETSP0164_2-20130417/103362_1 /TAXON_ID=221442 /ORGANISM="Coccolithus pelagicus ssp braarudi, Strain PLY182g" /LENGTH=275 /DNA_ID=CAMNT_0025547213 /DNA_START=75 /DNA_END=899 /DNA_ORIENTATION=+